MSRDWTPYELWNVEKRMSEEGNSLRNANYMFVDMVTGEKTPLIPDEEKKIGENYPMLSFLFEDWYRLYSKMDNEVVRDKVFMLYENTLRTIINEDDDANITISPTFFAYDPVKLWYFGQLDTHFYYREYNNELLGEHIWEFYNTEVQK